MKTNSVSSKEQFMMKTSWVSSREQSVMKTNSELLKAVCDED